MTRRTLLPLTCTLALSAATSASAATLSVGPTGQYATIQGAVDAAADGDVIEVDTGDYPELVNVRGGLDVSILGTGGSGATSISGSGANAILTIGAGATVTLDGFEFVANSPRAIVIDGGVLDATDLVVSGFDMTNIYDGDGAILCTDGELSVADSLFSGNHGEDAGHIRLESCDAVLTASTFLDGIADDDGGAIRADDADVVILDGWFEGNSAGSQGGVIYYADNGSLDVSNTVFAANGSGELGGVVSAGQQNFGAVDVIVADCEFTGNSGSFGGAIYARGTGDFTVTGTLFDGNAATTNGGAIRLFPDGTIAATLQSNVFVGNSAGDVGGGIAAGSSTTFASHDLALSGNAFAGNDAARGGGASLEAFAIVSGLGNSFCGNTSYSSGGGLRLTNLGGISLRLANNTFIENTTAGVGGGLAAFATPAGAGPDHQVENNTFVANDGADGGNVYVDQARVDFVNNIIAFATNGGGMFSTGGPAGSLDYNLWFGNVPSDTTGTLQAGDLGPNSVFADPDFVNFSQDGVCGNDLLTLNPGSPAIDAGDPGILDTDGSASDIGAFGGPDVPPGATEDNDADGWPGIADCDDGDATINPLATEVCDGVDNNCDGGVDDALATGATDWFPDRDGDGFGDDASMVTACSAPPSYGPTGGDCDDGDAAVNPNGTETCDGTDEDCDGTVDEGLTDTWYSDDDGDGYGDPASGLDLCGQPAGRVADNTDCDDAEATVNPAATEVCDGLDNNCDGAVDEGLVSVWYNDDDADGWGVEADFLEACQQPNGYVAQPGDCDDTNPLINPDAEDATADTVDQDCDGDDGRESASEKLSVISGCGCDTTTAPTSGAWLGAVGLLALLRRRKP